MRGMRKRGALITRLERLESGAVAFHLIKIRMGHLRRLPLEYQGPRHIVIAKHLPSHWGQLWVEYEEVAGPDPNPPREDRHGPPEYLDVMFVSHQRQE